MYINPDLPHAGSGVIKIEEEDIA